MSFNAFICSKHNPLFDKTGSSDFYRLTLGFFIFFKNPILVTGRRKFGNVFINLIKIVLFAMSFNFFKCYKNNFDTDMFEFFVFPGKVPFMTKTAYLLINSHAFILSAIHLGA